MKYQKINEINYLRTFEAAVAIKSYRTPLWTESFKSIGNLTLGVFLGTFGVARAACSTGLRTFDFIKNISTYKMLKISPERVEAIPVIVGAIVAMSALLFQFKKDDRIIEWENRARMLLKGNDLHTLMSKNQVETLLRGAPQEYRAVLSKYKPLNKRIVRKSNNIEKSALEKLFNVITTKVHRHRSKVYDGALNECGMIVKDQRVIEYFLKGRLNQETLRPIVLFALHSKFEFLKHACYEHLPLELRKALDGLWAGRI